RRDEWVQKFLPGTTLIPFHVFNRANRNATMRSLSQAGAPKSIRSKSAAPVATPCNDELRTFKKSPLHNWASHAADAFRYLSMAWREPMPELEKPDPIAGLLRPRTLNDVMK